MNGSSLVRMTQHKDINDDEDYIYGMQQIALAAISAVGAVWISPISMIEACVSWMPVADNC